MLWGMCRGGGGGEGGGDGGGGRGEGGGGGGGGQVRGDESLVRRGGAVRHHTVDGESAARGALRRADLPRRWPLLALHGSDGACDEGRTGPHPFSRPAPFRGSTGLAGVSTRPAGLPHPPVGRHQLHLQGSSTCCSPTQRTWISSNQAQFDSPVKATQLIPRGIGRERTSKCTSKRGPSFVLSGVEHRAGLTTQ